MERLQKLLTDKKVEFNTEAPEAQVNAARQAAGEDRGGGAVGGAAEKEEPKASMAVGQLELIEVSCDAAERKGNRESR